MKRWDNIEAKRIGLQAELDGQKSQEERNKLGQFATPTQLARSVLSYGLSLLPTQEEVRFLDPAIGTGSFYSALGAVASKRPIASAIGFEIDPHYGEPAKKLWAKHPLKIIADDFTTANPAVHGRANLLICNPPYVRHHHIDKSEKSRLQQKVSAVAGINLNGLSGLYCYFMGLAHEWMEDDGIAAWLIPSEFMDVNYGSQIKEYLLSKVTLLHVHRFDPADVQFSDALVSSAIVWIKKAAPAVNHTVRFTYGGSLEGPAISRHLALDELRIEKKWTRFPKAKKATVASKVTLGDLFTVKRGIATGDNKFFVLSRDQIKQHSLPLECFRPVLPSARHIPGDVIEADADGNPLLDKQLFLLNTTLAEDVIREKYPKLADYLQKGREGEKPVADGYLCKSRRPWYAQENRPPAPYICTYMGRPKKGAKPFRFILNDSQATACNVFLLLYPKPAVSRAFMRNHELKLIVWEFLNNISAEELIGKGRVYGGGLHKLEPKELLSVDATRLLPMLDIEIVTDNQPDLFTVSKLSA